MSRGKKGALVYFIKPVGLDGPIKIGHSWCPANRLIDLGAWSPWPLELIGYVASPSEDERFLHRCFADCHSHREWFHSTPRLRETITQILDAGTIDAVRSGLIPLGSIRHTRVNTAIGTRRMSCRMRIYWALRRLDGRDAPYVYWRAPDEVGSIMGRWSKNYRTGAEAQDPSAEEMAILEAFIANPEATATRHERTLKVVA